MNLFACCNPTQKLATPNPTTTLQSSTTILVTAPVISLIEASIQRASRHQKPESDLDIIQTFEISYLDALSSQNSKWASEEKISNLLHEEVKMTTLDKQSFQGKSAVVRRLNDGVSRLIKFLGENSQGEEADEKRLKECVEMEGPTKKSSGLWVMTFKFKHGVSTHVFSDEFKIKDGKIKRLIRSRG